MRSSCLLHLKRVVAEIASRLAREFGDHPTNIDVRESGMFKFFGKIEVILHSLVCLLEEGGQFTPEGCEIVESVQVVDDEGSHRFFALELLLAKVKSPHTSKLMHEARDYNFRIDIRREDHCRVHAGVQGVRLALAPKSLLFVIIFLGK